MRNRTSSHRNGTSFRNRTPYRQKVRALSDRLVEAQRPIRILDAIKWDEEIERAFFAQGGRELPAVTPDYYRSRPLPFDPDAKIEELHGIENDVRRQLGEDDAPGSILVRMCEEYRGVVWMLARRGTAAFGKMSAKLYGSAGETCQSGVLRLDEMNRRMMISGNKRSNGASALGEREILDAQQAVEILAARLQSYFRASADIRVRLSDGILADAAAGCDYIKLRGDARFTLRDVRLLEVHEGWVHLGTTLNGQSQPVCTFLGKGPPSSTITQEGLAVVTEILASASFPQRLRRLSHRVEGVALAEEGADFLEVFHFFRGRGYEARESYQHTVRIFRGSLPSGCGPFTKDICYSKGFGLVAEYVRGAVRQGCVAQVPLLFCGKTTLADLPALEQLIQEGLITGPQFVPPPFADLPALSAWTDATSSLGDPSADLEYPRAKNRQAV